MPETKKKRTFVYIDGFNFYYGIREKFGSRYIFMEYHWDAPSFATARPLEDLGPLPEGIVPDDSLGIFAEASGRKAYWDNEAKDEKHKLGRLRYEDTNEFCDEKTTHRGNLPLFEYLEPLDKVERERVKAEWEAHKNRLESKDA